MQSYLAVTDADYKKLPRAERKHFKRCSECRKWFDMRDLDEVFFHCVDGHVHKADIQFREPGWSDNTAA